MLCLVVLRMGCGLFVGESVEFVVDFGEFFLHFVEQFYSFVAVVVETDWRRSIVQTGNPEHLFAVICIARTRQAFLAQLQCISFSALLRLL